MIINKKIVFTVSIAFRDVPLFTNISEVEAGIKEQFCLHLQQLYPNQMIIDTDAIINII